MVSDSGREGHPVSIGTEVVAGAVSTGAGALLGGTVGAMAGAGLQPVLAQALHRAGAEIGLWRRTSAAKVLDHSSRLLGRSAEQVIDAAAGSPESAKLLADTMFAAAQTLNEEKIRALGRALANGLRDDQARPDEEQLVVAALADVEAPHIKVLTCLGPERSLQRTSASSLRSRSTPTSRGRRPALLAEECSLSVPAVRSVLSVLERAGMAVMDGGSETLRVDKLIMEMQEELNKLTELLTNPPKNGKIPSSKKPRELKRPGSPAAPGWTITAFGQRCLNYLEDLDDLETDVAATVLHDPGQGDR